LELFEALSKHISWSSWLFIKLGKRKKEKQKEVEDDEEGWDWALVLCGSLLHCLCNRVYHFSSTYRFCF
ncbi:hypothetical protein FRX31_025364, partial [Thalictrum thalictroides]